MRRLLCLQKMKSVLSVIFWRRIRFALILLPVLLLSLLLNSNTFATSVQTSSFDLYRVPRGSSDYSWVNGILYNQHISGVRSANKYQFQTSTLYPDGNLASLHFETNIVYSDLAPYNNPLVNLDYQNIIICNASNNTIETLAPRLSYAVTQWYPSNPDLPGRTNLTLTLYGDVVLKGFTKNQATQIVCAIGSDSYAFIDATTSSSAQYVYFEQNPMDVNFTDNETDALLQTQINQNTTIINQNQQIIDQDNKDRDDLQKESDNASDTADDLADDVTNASSSLLTIIGNFVNIVLNPPQADCRITLDVGNANFGQADLCSLSLPQPLAVIGTLFIVGFIITITVSLIMTFLSLLKGATQD